jgi:murein DD-endopeptidase MepM/ murein hydrolase activator NlpD
MARVVPEVAAETPGFRDRGDLLANYLAINGELREANAGKLRELAAASRPALLWEGAFLALPNGQVMSPFAERRAYRFGGERVDEQFHLGYDLASVRRASVPAANTGVVALAGYLGIYGNTVVVDHGYGLATLYGHLSEIAVEPGRQVARGETLGRTGETGLAAGDHLHFAVLLQGLPVDPVEWWDPAWVRDRVRAKLR